MKWLVALALPLAACDSCNDDKVRHTPDSLVIDARADASLLDASDPNSTVLITQSPPGPTNGDPATWGGVLQFQVSGDGGTSGSVSRFAYTRSTHAFTALPEITGNGLDGVHQVAFSPTTGELFAANQNNGISRFTFDARSLRRARRQAPLRLDGRQHDPPVRSRDRYRAHRRHAADEGHAADGGEMYVTGHRTSDLVQRYLHDASTDTWIPNGTMDLGTSLGGIVIAPG